MQGYGRVAKRPYSHTKIIGINQYQAVVVVLMLCESNSERRTLPVAITIVNPRWLISFDQKHQPSLSCKFHQVWVSQELFNMIILDDYFVSCDVESTAVIHHMCDQTINQPIILYQGSSNK